MQIKKLAAVALVAAGFAVTTTAQAQDKHNHAHDHAAEKKGSDPHGHGKGEDLGTTTVAGLKLSARQIGEVKAGAETVFGVSLAKGSTEPRAIRAWVGTESAEGSVKAKGEADGTDYDFHVEVPKSLPAGSQLWVEVTPAEGKKAKAGFATKK